MIENLQIGDAVEHRGIVITPLFPRHDPVAAYVTLDEALAGGLRIREREISRERGAGATGAPTPGCADRPLTRAQADV